MYRIEEIEKIERLEDAFEKTHGIRPLNLSTWLTAKEFSEPMNALIDFNQTGDSVGYIYSYDIVDTDRDKILSKLMASNAVDNTLIFTPNNTISIVNIINFIKQKEYSKVGIVAPFYFSIEYCLIAFDIPFEKINSKCNKDYFFSLPEKHILEKFDVLFITSPVFTNGQYLHKNDLNKISSLMAESNTLIIMDESFALPGHELIQYFGGEKNFIAIYSPHKAIQINALKFSMIACHRENRPFFHQWLDVFTGNLSFSNQCAIRHYLTDNYLQCYNLFTQYIASSKNKVSYILNEYSRIFYYKEVQGSILTVFFPDISPDVGRSEDFISLMIKKTYTSVIPGHLMGYSSSLGFCFRLNLSAVNRLYCQGLKRVLMYLSQAPR